MMSTLSQILSQPWFIPLVVGVLILAQWPYSGLTILGIFLGIDLLFAGASWIGIGLALRRRG